MLTVTNKVYEYRKAQGLSQDDAAYMCEISREQWNRIENGKSIPNLLTALVIASQLDVSVEELFQISAE